MDHGKITQKQLIILFIIYISGTLFVTLPRLLATTAQHTGWLCILLAMGLFVGYSFFLSRVVLMMKDMDYITFVHKLVGKWIGPSITMVFLLIPTLLYSAFVVRLVTELFVTLVIPETPLWILVAMILILRFWMTAGGIQTIGVYVELVLPGLVVVMTMMLSMSAIQLDLSRLTPFFDADTSGIVKGTMGVFGAYLEIGIVLFIGNRLRSPEHTYYSFNWINVWVGIVFLAVYFLSIGNFGVAFSQRMAFPSIEMIRNISIANFIEHIESIFLSIWVLMNLAKGATTMYACCVGLQSWFKLPSYRPLMMPVSIIVYFLALLPQNLLQAVFRFEHFKALAYPLYGFGTIVLLYLLGKWRLQDGGQTG